MLLTNLVTACARRITKWLSLDQSTWSVMIALLVCNRLWVAEEAPQANILMMPGMKFRMCRFCVAVA